MRRHPLDPLSLVAGVVLCAIGGVYLVGGPMGLVTQARLVATMLLIGIGLGLLVSVWPSGDRAEVESEVTPDPEPD